jgi:basic amino acid/polyamine antiporter, APA family
MSLFLRKTVSEIEATAASSTLRREFGPIGLTMLGIGATIGAGVFVLTGTAAANYAGPAVALSFIFAAVACLCAGLCYAELASMIPVSGSAYTYSYVAMGELVAWIIGWNLVLEYLFAVSTVAVGWSGYFSAFLNDLGIVLPPALTTAPITFHPDGGFSFSGALINLPALAIVCIMAGILSLGIKTSARTNAAMVMLKLGIILLVIVVGTAYVDTRNWVPFVPENTGKFGQFGWSGVVRAAGVVFYAYIGFDTVSGSSQEAKNPKRDVPVAILATLAVCTVLYVSMALVITGLAPYTMLNVPHPIYVAVAHAGPSLAWLKPVIGISIVVGLASAILVTLYGQTRIFYSMSRDGLIPRAFSIVSETTGVPVFNTFFVGATAAIIAALLPIDILGELVSIGTLLAFAIVCLGVLVLRTTAPEAPRQFRVRFVWPVSLLGFFMCLYMMVSLPVDTWIRFVVWLILGMIVYTFYGHSSSVLRAHRRQNGAAVD